MGKKRNHLGQYVKEDGTWSKDLRLNNSGKEIITTCSEELDSYNKAINQVANDLVLLYHTNNENNQERNEEKKTNDLLKKLNGIESRKKEILKHKNDLVISFNKKL